jgi:hypothetical protein
VTDINSDMRCQRLTIMHLHEPWFSVFFHKL